MIIYDDMETTFLDEAIEAFLAETLDDEQWQAVLAAVQKIIS